jgi:2-iminobutanoate/2-iminopropanoate deaminase
MKKLNPPTILAPLSNYVNGVVVEPNKRWLYTSGQVGVTKEGHCPEDFESQFSIAMDNIIELLKEANMGAEDIVKMTFFLVDHADLTTARKIRDSKLNNVPVASSLLFISGFVLPELKVEIECIAARA